MIGNRVQVLTLMLLGLGSAATLIVPGNVRAQVAGLIQPQQRFEAAKARGDLAAAIEAGREALALAERFGGAGSRDVVAALENLGAVSAMAGDYPSAVGYYERALTAQEQALGEAHPDLTRTLDALIEIHLQRKAYDEVEALLKRVLAVEQAAYGESHEYVLATMSRLRDLYTVAGRPDAAREIESAIANLDLRSRDIDARRYTTKDGFATVRVFYGTNRARSGKSKAAEFYGNGRGELDVGYVDVSIPETHKYGELESTSRWSIFTYTLGEDAIKRKYILLLEVAALDSASFHSQLREHVSDSPSDEIFLFIHGYNTSFEDAARRTAQLAYDLDFDGTPMMYSWPSQASSASYTVDEAVVRLSGRKLARLLDDVLAQSGAGRVHLIAHSMGNRALLEALEKLSAERPDADAPPLFSQVVFTAPDVDRDYFIDVVRDIRPIADRITLYASENDVALRSSAVIHGAPRAGLAGDSIVTSAGIDTIDMSDIKADLLGHGYFAADEGAIYDLFRLLWRGDPPDRRCGMESAEAFWSFDVKTCRGNALLEAGLLHKKFGRGARQRVQQRLGELRADQQQEREEWLRILDRLNELLDSSQG